ncbi:MAG: hypothetical protein ABI743_10255 [bacterium]
MATISWMTQRISTAAGFAAICVVLCAANWPFVWGFIIEPQLDSANRAMIPWHIKGLPLTEIDAHYGPRLDGEDGWDYRYEVGPTEGFGWQDFLYIKVDSAGRVNESEIRSIDMMG